MDRTISNRIFVALVLIYAGLAGVSIFLPSGMTPTSPATTELPAPLPVLALANAGIVLVLYGGLGFIGLVLSRKIGLPEIWDTAVTNRQRFLIPAIIGVGIGLVLVVADLLFAPFNGIGRFVHPPFPTSVVAAITAGIGEELMFRLFFISFWTWLIGRVILRGRWQTQVYWVVSVFSALAFAVGHLPSVMFLFGWTEMSQVPPVLLAEMILLNGLLAMVAAYLFKKFGYLAPVGVHLWADVIWHVLWGLF
jgi:hypothetical protein